MDVEASVGGHALGQRAGKRGGGAGIGSALLDELRARLEAQGVIDLVLGVLARNRVAVRLYERHGFRATWSYMSRFDGRPPR